MPRGWLVYWVGCLALAGLLAWQETAFDTARFFGLLAIFILAAFAVRAVARINRR
jgi:hypothetical protein